MLRSILPSAIVLVVAGASLASPPPRIHEPAPACLRWSAEAVYRPYGYDHIVHIHNTCSTIADCVVTTNVNPEPQYATVPPNTMVDVITWLRSPSREFEASVSCSFHAAP